MRDVPQIDAAFVETWSVRYRGGAENSRWRLNQSLKTALKDDEVREPLNACRTEWDVEQLLFGDVDPIEPMSVGRKVGDQGEMTRSDFLLVAAWKTPRQIHQYVKNDDQRVASTTRAAFASRLTPIERVRILDDLDGVGPAVASALLTVWDPQNFTVVDVWALTSLQMCGERAPDGQVIGAKSQDYWQRHYEVYVDACKRLRDRCCTSLRNFDRAIWKHGQIEGD